jgi:hypothetical protein
MQTAPARHAQVVLVVETFRIFLVKIFSHKLPLNCFCGFS